MARRYRLNQEQYEAYHRKYNWLRVNSGILNPNANKEVASSVSYDLSAIHSTIYAYQGNEHGILKNKELALIPWLERKLKIVTQKYKQINQDRENQGFNKLLQMPRSLVEEKHILEARLDIANEELEKLYELKKAKENKPEKLGKSICLKHGCSGISKLRRGILATIDGQKVSMIKKGIFVIDDPESPYTGMLVQDYREFVQKPWRQAKSELSTARLRLIEKLSSKGKSETFDKKWAVKSKKIVERNSFQHLFSIQQKNKPSIPTWPEGVKKYS